MSVRNLLADGSFGRATRLLVGGLALAALAAPASAYVVVTSDNRVYDVATKPEVRGDLVIFQINGNLTGGNPVSLRVYDVNVAKTNELNHMFDSGAGTSLINAAVRSLRPAVPEDGRLIVSSRLEQVLDKEYGEQAEVARREAPGEIPSFDRDRPGARQASAPPRTFEREARAALDEAEQRQRSSRQAAESDESAPAASSSRGSGRPGRSQKASARDAGKVADLDAEIKAEQEYLKKLTSGELTVSDLDSEIDRSMDKIKKLQKRRDAAASEAAEVQGESGGGSYPSGSREDKWERELQDAQSELARLKQQQSGAADSTREREALDERIGELQYKIDRLQKKLGR